VILSSLKLNPLSPAGMDWYTRMTAGFETRALENVEPFLHDEIVLELNNAIPFYGKSTTCMALERFWVAVGDVDNEPLNLYGDDRHFSAELLVHYRPPKMSEKLTLPMAIFYARDVAGLLTSMRVFVDLRPIYGP